MTTATKRLRHHRYGITRQYVVIGPDGRSEGTVFAKSRKDACDQFVEKMQALDIVPTDYPEQEAKALLGWQEYRDALRARLATSKPLPGEDLRTPEQIAMDDEFEAWAQRNGGL